MRKSIIGEPRVCPTCKREFPHTHEFFYKKSGNISGLDCYCKECSSIRTKISRENNPELHKQYDKKSNTKRRLTGKAKEYAKKKRDNNIGVKILSNLQSELRYAIKSSRAVKYSSSFDLFGCSREFLVSYLEGLFTNGMTLDNYGKKGWWIDHIRPCASFDLTNPEEQKLCFHYTNLRPMWYRDNIKKSSWYMGKKHVYKK